MYDIDENGLPVLPSGEELEKELHEAFLPQDEWEDVDIEGDWLDVTEEYQRPKYTLAYNGIPFAPLGGVHALTGQPGHGKTMTFTQLMVAILKGKYGKISYNLAEVPSPKVLYIDTEMEKGNTQLVNLRVYSLMGWSYGVPHDEFKVLMLRETTSAVDRWRKTLKAIHTVKPTVCFIDGLLDEVNDFNDNKECADIIYKCMATASHYGISLWCLVHENPGSTKMVGHIGSLLERKATDIFGTIKDKDVTSGNVTFTVRQKKARGKDIPDWCFTVEDGNNKFGIPQQIGDDVDDPSVILYRRFESFMPVMGYNTRDLRLKVASVMRVDASKATEIIDQAVELGILNKEEEWNGSHTKLKKCNYTINHEFISKDKNEMPF